MWRLGRHIARTARMRAPLITAGARYLMYQASMMIRMGLPPSRAKTAV